eukprot:7642929-Pyramimonas_sp.AAC.1
MAQTLKTGSLKPTIVRRPRRQTGTRSEPTEAPKVHRASRLNLYMMSAYNVARRSRSRSCRT